MGRMSRPAMTLIEVVTGLAIMGTVLASLAIARGRFARQWAAADRKLATARALDAQISEWMDRSSGVPVLAEGVLAGANDCTWRTRTIHDPAALPLGATVVRIEVFQRGPQSPSALPILNVDLLVHVKPTLPRMLPVERESTGGVAP
jgi:type II secretory pathway pseudopilin PulG